MIKENFAKRMLKGIGFCILGEVMCIFLVMSVIVINVMFFEAIIAVCAVAVQLGLLFNWANSTAKKDRELEKLHKIGYDKFMPYKMALAAPVFSYIGLIALFLSKIGIIPDIYNYFLLANIYILPSAERAISALSWAGFGGIALLVLLQGVTVAVTYILTLNEIDIIQLIVYKKK